MCRAIASMSRWVTSSRLRVISTIRALRPAAPASRVIASNPLETQMPYFLKVDRVTQGPPGMERAANPQSIDSGEFLWVYVGFDLPTGARPQGEASNLSDPSGARFPVRGDEAGPALYKFQVDHFTLSAGARYRFRFADDLMRPTYEDHLEIQTR